jgi:hypothetical protein
MSADYGNQHDDYFRTSHQDVNHGVKIADMQPADCPANASSVDFAAEARGGRTSL